MSGAIGPGDWVKVVVSPSGKWLGHVCMVTRVLPPNPNGCTCDDLKPHAGLHVTDLPPPMAAYCVHAFIPFHGPEQSSLGLSRKLPTCEPAS